MKVALTLLLVLLFSTTVYCGTCTQGNDVGRGVLSVDSLEYEFVQDFEENVEEAETLGIFSRMWDKVKEKGKAAIEKVKKGAKKVGDKGRNLIEKGRNFIVKSVLPGGLGGFDQVSGEYNSEKCLKKLGKQLYFCTVNCDRDFGLCKGKEFAVFVPKTLHWFSCALPRVGRKIKGAFHKASREDKAKCLLRPCACTNFLGKGIIRKFFKTSQEMEKRKRIYIDICTRWCTTGDKPAGVIESSHAEKVAIAQNYFAAQEFARIKQQKPSQLAPNQNRMEA